MKSCYNTAITVESTNSSSLEHGQMDEYCSASRSNVFDDRYEQLLKHSAINHPLFDYLLSQSVEGFTPKQFQIYRDTFFARTAETFPSVLRVALAAAAHQDHFTVAKVGSNIYDESGEGNPKLTHCRLLEESHNLHGKLIFSLPPLSVGEAISSPFCISEISTFREVQLGLYTHPEYPRILGASMAQELAANTMLENFYNAFFLPYKKCYHSEIFTELSLYFIKHTGEPGDLKRGAEARHGIDSKNSAKNICHSVHELEQVFMGALQFLEAQGALWTGLLSSIKSAYEKKNIIHVKTQ